MGARIATAQRESMDILRPIDHMVAYSDAFCALTGWPMRRLGRLRYLESGIPHSLFNWIYGSPESLDLKQVNDFIAILGQAPASWLCDTSEAGAMQPFLDALPIAHMHQVKGVSFDLKTYESPSLRPVGDLVIKPITSRAQMALFDQLSAPTFVHEAGMALNFMQGIPTKKPSVHQFDCYLIEYKGRPVGFFQTYTYENVRGIYWGGILPEARNNGIGSAAFDFALKESKDLGHSSLVAHLLPSSWSLVDRFMPYKQEMLDFYILMP